MVRLASCGLLHAERRDGVAEVRAPQHPHTEPLTNDAHAEPPDALAVVVPTSVGPSLPRGSSPPSRARSASRSGESGHPRPGHSHDRSSLAPAPGGHRTDILRAGC